MFLACEYLLFIKYLFSKSILSLLDGGIIKLPKINESIPNKTAEIINGFNNLLKLIPLFSMAIISVLLAILEVKNISSKKGWFFIEDVAQAFGAKVGNVYAGSIGDVSILSFGEGKPIAWKAFTTA